MKLKLIAALLLALTTLIVTLAGRSLKNSAQWCEEELQQQAADKQTALFPSILVF